MPADDRIRSLAVFAAAAWLLAACSGEEVPSATGNAPPSPASSTPSPNAAHWRVCDSASISRQEVATAVVGAKVFVAGGLTGTASKSTLVESYDTALDAWTTVTPLPVGLDHAMATTWRGKLVVLGGNSATGPDDRVYALDGDSWTQLPRLRRARAAGAAVTVGDQIVVIGGTNDDGHVRASEIFDGERWRDGPNIGEERDHLAAVTDGRSVYTVGGRRGGAQSGAFEVADIRTGTVKGLTELPTPRSGFGAAFVDGRVVTVGGEGPRMFPEVEAYNVASKTWSRLPDMGVPRHGVGVVAVGSKVYALVGGTRVGLEPSSACEVLDPA